MLIMVYQVNDGLERMCYIFLNRVKNNLYKVACYLSLCHFTNDKLLNTLFQLQNNVRIKGLS